MHVQISGPSPSIRGPGDEASIIKFYDIILIFMLGTRHWQSFFFLSYCKHSDRLYLQIELSTKFKVDAIPSLVFVDGKTGQLINRNGRSVVTDDPRGEDFPWKPKPLSTVMANVKFIDKNKKETTWNELQGKMIAFFFSARWVMLIVAMVHDVQ